MSSGLSSIQLSDLLTYLLSGRSFTGLSIPDRGISARKVVPQSRPLVASWLQPEGDNDQAIGNDILTQLFGEKAYRHGPTISLDPGVPPSETAAPTNKNDNCTAPPTASVSSSTRSSSSPATAATGRGEQAAAKYRSQSREKREEEGYTDFLNVWGEILKGYWTRSFSDKKKWKCRLSQHLQKLLQEDKTKPDGEKLYLQEAVNSLGGLEASLKVLLPNTPPAERSAGKGGSMNSRRFVDNTKKWKKPHSSKISLGLIIAGVLVALVMGGAGTWLYNDPDRKKRREERRDRACGDVDEHRGDDGTSGGHEMNTFGLEQEV